MQVRVFTLRFNPATEVFEDSAVTQFLADKEVCSIRDLTRWLQFLEWLLPATEKFPKRVRFTFGENRGQTTV